MTRVVLDGCSCEPLGSYLKSLAVLRLIAGQKDPAIKGWWEDGIFCIDSRLDREGIFQFFLEEYRPTPIVAPWGARSGFYPMAKPARIRILSVHAGLALPPTSRQVRRR